MTRLSSEHRQVRMAGLSDALFPISMPRPQPLCFLIASATIKVQWPLAQMPTEGDGNEAGHRLCHHLLMPGIEHQC